MCVFKYLRGGWGCQDMCLTLTWEERNGSPLRILLTSFHREFIQQFHLERHSFLISIHSFHMYTYTSIKHTGVNKQGWRGFLFPSNQQFVGGIWPINPAYGRPEHMVWFFPPLHHRLLAVQSTTDRVEHFCPFNLRDREPWLCRSIFATIFSFSRARFP